MCGGEREMCMSEDVHVCIRECVFEEGVYVCVNVHVHVYQCVWVVKVVETI